MNTKAIGGRISFFRVRANMTQSELAEKLGCTPQHVSAIERGIKTPRLDTFVDIANVLRVQPNLLLQDVLEHWQDDWDAELDRVLEAVPASIGHRVKQEILIAQQAAEETEGLRIKV